MNPTDSPEALDRYPSVAELADIVEIGEDVWRGSGNEGETVMSEMLAKAEAAVSEKLGGADLGGAVKFDIEGEGPILVASDGTVSQGDGEADVTITASPEVFNELMAGELNPTSAYMSGRLKIDGDMGFAMKLASMLA